VEYDLYVWIALLFIATVHLMAGHLRFLSVRPRSRWLSAGGGVGVAYVFLHLLPDLQAHHEALRDGAATVSPWQHAYLIALLGLVIFYGLEHRAKRSRKEGNSAEPDTTSPLVFWISVGAFAAYNALLCYLIAREVQHNGAALLLFPLAIAVHFAVNDFALHQHHKRLYDRYGRALLASAAVLGGIAGKLIVVPEGVMASLMALLIGSMILNVLKEELPEVCESRFIPFLLGAFGYSALLLAI
jgi:hypothetical protein